MEVSMQIDEIRDAEGVCEVKPVGVKGEEWQEGLETWWRDDDFGEVDGVHKGSKAWLPLAINQQFLVLEITHKLIQHLSELQYQLYLHTLLHVSNKFAYLQEDPPFGLGNLYRWLCSA